MSGWWFPENASKHGVHVDDLNFFLHIFMLILFVGWGTFYLYCLFRFRRKEGVAAVYEPIHAKGAKVLEVAVVLIELALLILVSIPVWTSIKTSWGTVDKKNALEVRVIAEQFAWNFHYPGADGTFGRTDIKKMDAGNSIGLDRSDPYAKDDIVSREMRLPVNRDIVAYLSSKDVIHSFGVHELRVKHDTIPGMEIPIWFHVTKTSDELRTSGAHAVPIAKAPLLVSYMAMQDYAGVTKGSAVSAEAAAALQQSGVQEVVLGRRDPIEIACSQLCGLGHYKMKGVLIVETEEKFQEWLASRAPKTASAPAPAPTAVPAAPVEGQPTDGAVAPTGEAAPAAEGTPAAAAPVAEGTPAAAAPAPAEGAAATPAAATDGGAAPAAAPTAAPSASQP